MIIVFRNGVTSEQIERVVEKVRSYGLRTHLSRGTSRTILGCIGDERVLADVGLKAMDGVEEVIPILRPYKLAARELVEGGSQVRVGSARFGADEIVVIAGPCAVEGQDLLEEVAAHVARQGARVLRGGAFKPRTSPYAFRGLGERALQMLAEVREQTGLAVVTEVMEPRQVDLVAAYADMLQIGARNMQNFGLLEEAGRLGKPILLKRGMSAEIREFLLAAEYVLNQGNMQVVLCERGIRTFETTTRNTLDISAVPVLKRETHLPVVVDPSHASGRRDIIPELTAAAVAAGADGIMVEVHPRPDEALSDADQALSLADFDRVMEGVRVVSRAVGRSVNGARGVEASA